MGHGKEAVIKRTEVSVDPKKLNLPKEVIETLPLTLELVLERDPKKFYKISVNGPVVGKCILYMSYELDDTLSKYKDILNDLNNGDYKVFMKIKLLVFPQTFFLYGRKEKINPGDIKILRI